MNKTILALLCILLGGCTSFQPINTPLSPTESSHVFLNASGAEIQEEAELSTEEEVEEMRENSRRILQEQQIRSQELREHGHLIAVVIVSGVMLFIAGAVVVGVTQ